MRTKSGRGDVLLVCMVLFLVVFGLAVLYSTGSYNGSVRFGDAFYYMKKQFFAAALGMLAMYLISCMDYHIFEKYAIAAYLISLALSTLVLFAGNAYNGSRRWLSLGPLSFQPSEFAKLAVILFLARMVGRQKKKRNSFLNLVFVIALVLPIVALVGTNNLSTAIIILGIAVIVVFVSDKRYMQFVWIAAAGAGMMRCSLGWSLTAWRGSPSGKIRKLTKRAIRQSRDFMRSVPADCSVEDSARASRSSDSCRRHRMI